MCSFIKIFPIVKMEGEPLKTRSIKKNRQTNFFETFIHVLKGNIGSAAFALSSAYRHSGILFGPLVTILLAIICVNLQHVLIKCSDKLAKDFNFNKRLDYADTLELSLLANEKWKNFAKPMKIICNIFLIITQLGFCAVYFIFIGKNLRTLLEFYGFGIELKNLMFISLFPIMATILVTNLKFLSMILIFCILLHTLI